MLVAEERQYEYILEEPKSKPKKRVKTRAKVKRVTKVKCITFTVIGLLIALTILVQYVKLNTLSQDIISMEKELQELEMINDSIEGELLASEDLKQIEKIAKDQLGMIEPTAEQMTIIETQNSQNTEQVATRQNVTPRSTGLLGTISKILHFID